MAPGLDERSLDDYGIKGGSPIDRIIGMLLERTEAVRELHDAMRVELRSLIDTHADVKAMMATLAERMENHERSDTAAFQNVKNTVGDLGAKIDALSASVLAATTAGVVQKAQFSAGWKVLVVIGSIAFFVSGVFFGFFNHKW